MTYLISQIRRTSIKTKETTSLYDIMLTRLEIRKVFKNFDGFNVSFNSGDIVVVSETFPERLGL